MNAFLTAILALGSACASVGAAILAVRTPGLRFRWLWAIGSLIGIGWLQAGWDSGAVYSGFGINAPPFGASKHEGAAEWWVRASVPAIALLFLALRATGRLTSRPSAQADEA
jgi:hypothetical protein